VGDFEERHILIEAYYDEEGKVVAWAEASPPDGETIEALVAELEVMHVAAHNARMAELGLASLPAENKMRALVRHELPGGTK
jgi:hypothetical protein